MTGRITERGVGTRSHAGLTLLSVIDSSTKGFLEILSNVLVAQERSLSFMYGRPDESCSSFALMYFSKRRASRIDLFWSRWILLMIVSDVVVVESEPYSKIGLTHCLWICNIVDGLGHHFVLTISLRQWYLVLQRLRISSKCFWNASLESKVIPRNFTCG